MNTPSPFGPAAEDVAPEDVDEVEEATQEN